jgi:hypothetical protein
LIEASGGLRSRGSPHLVPGEFIQSETKMAISVVDETNVAAQKGLK